MISYSFLRERLFAKIEDIPESLKKSYYPSLDGLRGFAILSVILRHISADKSWGVWVDGTIGIQVFFLISGFLITTILLKEKIVKGKVSLKSFYIRRILRIFPVAYLFVFTLIILKHIFHLDITAKSFITSIFYLKNLPIAGDWYTGHFWSLSVEEQFYLLAPILLIIDTNKYIKIILGLFLLVPIVDFLGFNNVGVFYNIHIIHVVTFIFLALFDQGTMYILLGSLFSIMIFKKIIIIERFRKYYFLSASLFTIALIVHFTYLIGVIPYLSSIVFAILMAFVITLIMYEDNLLASILKNPILVQVGILSYSLYIWQQIFTTNQPWKNAFKYSDNVFLNVTALFLVAFLSYSFCERKFLKLKSKFKY